NRLHYSRHPRLPPVATIKDTSYTHSIIPAIHLKSLRKSPRKSSKSLSCSITGIRGGPASHLSRHTSACTLCNKYCREVTFFSISTSSLCICSNSSGIIYSHSFQGVSYFFCFFEVLHNDELSLFYAETKIIVDIIPPVRATFVSIDVYNCIFLERLDAIIIHI